MHGYIAGILADSELLRPLLESSTQDHVAPHQRHRHRDQERDLQKAARRDLRCCRCR